MPRHNRVLIADNNIHPQGVELLQQSAELLQIPAYSSEEEIIESVSNIDGILLRACTISAPVIQAAGKLQIISRHGVGFDNIDVEACTRHGIVVSITESANAQAVSEYTFACLLALANKIVPADAGIRQGLWNRVGNVGLELSGKALGIFAWAASVPGSPGKPLPSTCK